MKLVDTEQLKKIIYFYNQGMSRPEIASRVHLSVSGVGRRLEALYKDGTLKKRSEMAEEEHEALNKRHTDEGTVKCNYAVSKKCVYGYESTHTCRELGLCDYILRTGHMRGCSAKNCTKFEEITKDNPRRKDVM